MSRRKEPSIPNDILDQLLAGTDAAAALSQGGFLDSLKKAFAERALNAEMDHHLGHDDQVGNNRNGYGRKTVATDSGRIEIEVPRDRAGSFDPQLIVLLGPDHYNGFFYDVMPPFCIGMAADAIGDFDTAAGPLDVPKALAEACAEAIETMGAQALVIGGGPLGQAAQSLNLRFSVPVIAPIPAAVRLAQKRVSRGH